MYGPLQSVIISRVHLSESVSLCLAHPLVKYLFFNVRLTRVVDATIIRRSNTSRSKQAPAIDSTEERLGTRVAQIFTIIIKLGIRYIQVYGS